MRRVLFGLYVMSVVDTVITELQPQQVDIWRCVQEN
jgi:hypothetical protein